MRSNEPETKCKQIARGFGTVGITVSVFILLLLFGGGFLIYYQKIKSPSQMGKEATPPVPVSEATPPKTPPSSSEIDTSNWKTYRNEKYGFEVKYPNNWYLGEIMPEKVFTPGVGLYMTDYAAVFGRNRKLLPSNLVALQGSGVTIRVQIYQGSLKDLNEFEKKSGDERNKEPFTVSGRQGFKIEYRSSLPYRRGVSLARLPPYGGFNAVSGPYHVVEWRFEDGEKVFRFILYDVDNTKENENVYWLFVESFKFIPSTNSGQVK
jgi:hypothetical protein